MIKDIIQNAQKTPPVVTYTELWGWGTLTYGEQNDGINSILPYNIPGNYVSGSTGLSYTMAIKNDNTLWGWGNNAAFGKIGDGGTTNRSSPVQIGTLTNWSDVQAGLSTTMAIKTDGTLWVWGHNTTFGMLGTSESLSTAYSSPIQLGTDTNWKQVSQRSTHACAVKTNGTLWMWGNNASGQLGQNNITPRSSPVQVGTLTNWSSVSTGLSHTLAVKTDGTLWAWGVGTSGRLGTNSTANRSSPVQIGTLTNWSQVSAGALSFAVKTDGTLWGWGGNLSYNLGDGTNVDRSSPVQIGTNTNWSSVSTNALTRAYNNFGIKTDGTLWTWGSTNQGTYGNGLYTTSVTSPVQVGTLTNWNFINNAASHTIARTSDGKVWTWGDTTNGANQLGYSTVRSSPVQIGTLTNWGGKIRAAGQQFTLADKQDGSIWGFGWNDAGQLAQNNIIHTAYPISLPITVSSFTVGYNYALAIKSDGTLWSWGIGNSGRLGDGTIISRSSPVQIGADTNWSKIAAGNASFAIKTTGTLWAWGDGVNFGLLGQNDAVNRSSPVQVGTLTNWSNIYAITNTVYAIKTDGTLWSWGRNESGQMGINAVGARSSPVQVGTLTNWASAAYGGNATHGGAIKTDGTLWMWGNNNNGQLGLNDTTNRSSPVQVGTLTNWSKVTVSASNTVAIKTDGTIWTWGNGTTAGMTGQNDFVNRSSPVQLGTGNKWVDVWSGDSFTIAVKSYQ